VSDSIDAFAVTRAAERLQRELFDAEARGRSFRVDGPLREDLHLVLTVAAVAADVSRETSHADPTAVDPMRVPLGTLVDVVPRSRTNATLASAVSTRATFIRWVGNGALDRDAIVEVEVAGRLTAFQTRDYAVRLVR
jgi:hypothetical protein